MPYANGPSVRRLSKIATLLLAKNYIIMLQNSVDELKRLVADKCPSSPASSPHHQPRSRRRRHDNNVDNKPPSRSDRRAAGRSPSVVVTPPDVTDHVTSPTENILRHPQQQQQQQQQTIAPTVTSLFPLPLTTLMTSSPFIRFSPHQQTLHYGAAVRNNQMVLGGSSTAAHLEPGNLFMPWIASRPTGNVVL